MWGGHTDSYNIADNSVSYLCYKGPKCNFVPRGCYIEFKVKLRILKSPERSEKCHILRLKDATIPMRKELGLTREERDNFEK